MSTIASSTIQTRVYYLNTCSRGVGIVGFNVSLDTLQVISETVFRVVVPTNNIIALKDNG